jgi:hypothetical protein
VPSERSDDEELELPPTDCLWRTASTVVDVWREWEVGVRDKLPIRLLEERWGPRWRRDGPTRVEWCRRKKILDEVRRLIRQERIPTEEALRRLEHVRAGRSLSKLVKHLTESRRQ